MNKYKIEPQAFLAQTSNLFISGEKDSFKIVKISESQAMTIKSRSEQNILSSFEQALSTNGLNIFFPLREYEVYNGYIAVWRGGCLKAYHLVGAINIARDPNKFVFADPRYKEALLKGELLEANVSWKNEKGICCYGGFRQVVPMCGYYGDKFLQDAEIGKRFEEAILHNDWIIALEEEEKDAFIKFTFSFTNRYFSALTPVE